MPTSTAIRSAPREEQLILVDEQDEAVGVSEKHAAHREGLLHRAFSIFLFDETGRVLLQRRALVKYHSAGLWANACCGHPRPGEAIGDAATRRLREELGLSAPLSLGFHARYRTALDGGMIENEFVHVFGGRLPAGPIRPNPDEADAVELIGLDELQEQVVRSPERYAYWLRHYLREHGDQVLAMAAAMRSAPSPDVLQPHLAASGSSVAPLSDR
jgi:isopentenyl-diphosphate Delta-isomerase